MSTPSTCGVHLLPRLNAMRTLSPRTPWLRALACSTLVALGLPLGVATATSASEARVVVAGVSPLPVHDVVVKNVITTSIDLALHQSHQAALTSFITSLSNSASPNYHHFLTPTQYAQRFGASSASVNAVSNYLRAYGLHVGALSKGRNILHASGTTTDIARAFDAKIVTVREVNGSLAAQLTSTATIPPALARDVTAVAGLSAVQPVTSLGHATHASRVSTASSCPSAGDSTGTTPNNLGGYTLQQQAELYGLGAEWALGNTGVGQTIGVYELANYYAGNVSNYFNCYGLSPIIKQINVDGGPTTADNTAGPGSAPPTEEATLDVEEASALAPGATIEVYQGTNNASGPTDIYSQMASDNTASIITTSWGICEAQTSGSASTEQPIFQEMAAQGQTVIAAAGDSGSSDCQIAPIPSPVLAVDDPASQPYVTGVGGLRVNDINPLDQTVWNDSCTTSGCGAGGGGISTLWSQPSWQVGSGIQTTAASGGMRMVPDLSVMADPSTGFIEYYNSATNTCTSNCASGWSGVGGTSIGAPLVSALVAVAAQSCLGVSGGRLGFINPTLYHMAPTGFVDVTVGNNDLLGVGGYSATPGYDMASGLGSPNGAAFFAGLCPPTYSASLSSFSLSSKTATSLTIGPTINATLRDTQGSPIVNAALDVTATAPAGLLNIDNDHFSAKGLGNATYSLTSDANGTVSFSVSSTVAQTVTVTLSYLNKPIYTSTVVFKNAASTNGPNKPGAPSIRALAPLIGGFALRLGAPSSNGGSPITSYQYSITNGATWRAVSRTTLSVNVKNLKKGAAYNVIVRAINVIGASHPSAKKKVVTRL